MRDMEIQRLRLALAVAATLVAGRALAAEGSTPDAPVATAPAHEPMGVAEQIEAFIRTSPAAAHTAGDGPVGVVADDRRVHGEVSVGIGTGGYRSFYARTDVPLGDAGRLSIAIAKSRHDVGDHDYGRFGPGSGFDSGFDGPVSFRADRRDRQRCDLEAMTPERRLDVEGGPHGRCRQALLPR